MVRGFLVLTSAVLALFMNYLRSLVLTLLANSGVKIEGMWHDLTAYSVVGLVMVLIVLLARFFEESTAPSPRATSGGELLPLSRASGMLAGLWAVMVFGALVWGGFLVQKMWKPTTALAAGPSARELLVSEVPGWRVEVDADLGRFSEVLKTEDLAHRMYSARGASDKPRVGLYLAHWAPQQATVSAVALHSPEACWPGAGWQLVGEIKRGEKLEHATGRLPPVSEGVFKSGENLRYVWYWHIHDGRVMEYGTVYSVVELLRLAWRHGFRPQGDQYFIRISSDQPWAVTRQAAPVVAALARFEQIGLVLENANN